MKATMIDTTKSLFLGGVCLFLMLMNTTQVLGQTVSFTVAEWASAQGLNSGASVSSYTQGGVTVSFEQGSGSAVTWNGTAIVAASGNSMTVTAANGFALDAASFTVAGANAQATRLAGNSWSTGSAVVNSSNLKQVDWTGNATTLSVTFTGNQTFASFSFDLHSTDNAYYVTFLDDLGYVLKVERVQAGGSATAPTPPTIPGRTFTGWSGAFNNVIEDVTVQAQYEFLPSVLTDTVQISTAEFKAYNEFETSEEFTYADFTKDGVTLQIAKGTSWNTPSIGPTNWCLWDADEVLKVSGNILTITTPFVMHKIILRHDAPCRNTSDEEVAWEGSASCVTLIPSGEIYSLRIIGDASDHQFTVKFYDLQGNVAKTEQVQIGGNATAPIITHECFDGWDQLFTNVQSDLDVHPYYSVSSELTAQEWYQDAPYSFSYSKNGYTVTTSYEYDPSRTQPIWYARDAMSICFESHTPNDQILITNDSLFHGIIFTCRDTANAERFAKSICNCGMLRLRGTEVHWIGETNHLLISYPDNLYSNADILSFGFACEYYEQVPCVVIFLDENGQEIARETVMAGESVTPPAAPAPADACMEFVRWSADLSVVRTDITVQPMYEPRKLLSLTAEEWYTTVGGSTREVSPITVNGFTLEAGGRRRYDSGRKAMSVSDNTPIKIKNPNYMYNLTFTCSSLEDAQHLAAGVCSSGSMIQDSLNVIWTGGTDSLAVFSSSEGAYITAFASVCSQVGPFTVIFYNADSLAISTQTIPVGGNAVAPADPVNPNYCLTFAGWDKGFTNVHANLNVYPLYDEPFVLTAAEWRQNSYDQPTYVKNGYRVDILGDQPLWVGSGMQVSPNNEIMISRSTNFQTMLITCASEQDATLLAASLCSSGALAQDGVKVRWTGDAANLSISYGAPATATAPWEEQPTFESIVIVSFGEECHYIPEGHVEVTFVDYYGATIETQFVIIGGTAVAPANPPALLAHTFVGWDKPLTNITESQTIRAQYEFDKNSPDIKTIDEVNALSWDEYPEGSQVAVYGIVTEAPYNLGDGGKLRFTIKVADIENYFAFLVKNCLGPNNTPFVSKYQIERLDTVYVVGKREWGGVSSGFAGYIGKANPQDHLLYTNVPDAALLYDLNGDGTKQALVAEQISNEYDYYTEQTSVVYDILKTTDYAGNFAFDSAFYQGLTKWNGNTTNFPVFYEDINHDGKVDLGLPFSSYMGGVNCLSALSKGAGAEFLDNALILPNFDANGDGRMDYMSFDSYSSSTGYYIHYQQADGSFRSEHMIVMSWEEYQAQFDPTEWAALADVRSNGYSSGNGLIANTNYGAGMSGLSAVVLARAPQRDREVVRAPSIGYTIGLPTRALDLNADGFIDLVDEKNGIMFMNMGDGKWVTTYTNGIVVPADLNNDGLMDYIFPGSQLYTSIYQGEGQFTTTSIYSNAAQDDLLYCYDFDHDGDIDILSTFSAIANATGTAYTCFFLNDGQGHFSQQPEQNYGNDTLWFSACQDINGDGYMDLLAFRGEMTYTNWWLEGEAYKFANNGKPIDVVWLQGSANNNFAAPQVLYTIPHEGEVYCYNKGSHYSSLRINAEDLDNDGKAEIWTSGLNDGKTTVMPFETAAANTAPTAPAAPTLIYDNGILTVTWGSGSDAETPTGDLTYALRIGTTAGGNEILAAHANQDGSRRNFLDGNMGKNHTYTVNLSSYAPCSLFVAVQAIDAQHLGSTWSAEATIAHTTIPAAFTLSRTTINNNETVELHYNNTLPDTYVHTWAYADGLMTEEIGLLTLRFLSAGQKVITHTVTAPDGRAASHSATLTVLPAGVENFWFKNQQMNMLQSRYKSDFNYDGLADAFASPAVWQGQSLGTFTQAVGLWNTNLAEGTSKGSPMWMDFNKNGFADLVLGFDNYYLPHADNAPDMVAKITDANVSYFLTRGDYGYCYLEGVDLLHNGYPTSYNTYGGFWNPLSDGTYESKAVTVTNDDPSDQNNKLRDLLQSDNKNRLVDYDRDGFVDLLKVKYEWTDNVSQFRNLLIYRNKGNAVFERVEIPFAQSIAYDDCYEPMFADFNSDGYVDIIAERTSDHAIYVLWNNANQSFSAPDLLPLGELLSYQHGYIDDNNRYGLIDVDNNGYPDVMITAHNPEQPGDLNDSPGAYVWYMGPQGVLTQGFIAPRASYYGSMIADIPNELFLVSGENYSYDQDSIPWLRVVTSENTAPETPTGVRAVQTADGLLIEWNAAEDDHTPAMAMRYNLSVKHASATGAGAYVISPQNGGHATAAYQPGYMYIAANRFLVPMSVLTSGNYEIAVQALDQRNMMSEFSPVVTVNVDRQAIEAPTTLCAGDDALITYMGPDHAGTPVWNFDGAQVQSGSGFGPYHLAWAVPGTKTITLTLNNKTYTRMLYVDNNEAFVALPSALFDGASVEVTLPKNMEDSWEIIIDGSAHSITSSGIDGRDKQLTVSNGVLTLNTKRAWDASYALTNYNSLILVLTLTNQNGCESTIQQNVTILSENTRPQIRLVTSNADGHNVITWNADASVFPQIQVLKETNIRDQFVELGTVNTSAGSYVDLSSDATQRSDRYAIRGVMNGNVKTPVSTVHQTVHMTINRGVNDNQWNLIWNNYVGADVVSYNILRGSSATNLQQIASLSSYNTSYTDNLPDASKPYYAIEYVLNGSQSAPSRPATLWATLINPSGRSNVANRTAARTVTYAQSMTILSANGLYQTTADQPLLLLYTEIMPSNTTYRNVAWSIATGSNLATIDQSSGLLTAKTPNAGGTVTVQAVALDGSGITASRQITIAAIRDNTPQPTYYTIRFVNWNGVELQSSQVLEGIVPIYTGETPTRGNADESFYVFTGWTPELAPATANATYTATYESHGVNIENVEATDPKARKVFRDGHIYILLPDGKEYDATGKKVK